MIPAAFAYQRAELRPIGGRRPFNEHYVVWDATLGQPVVVERERAKKSAVEVPSVAVVSSGDDD